MSDTAFSIRSALIKQKIYQQSVPFSFKCVKSGWAAGAGAHGGVLSGRPKEGCGGSGGPFAAAPATICEMNAGAGMPPTPRTFSMTGVFKTSIKCVFNDAHFHHVCCSDAHL